MSTLLIRLSGPMQSWGVQSRFEVRDTLTMPTKSGVIGLICAALGRDRSEPIDDLASLRMGVRVDRGGEMRRDYHTACDVAIASGGRPKECQPSVRHYLADAQFIVGLEGEDRSLLERISDALRNPFWPLSLGRKSFVPGEPVYIKDGVREMSLLDSLRHDTSVRLRYAIEYRGEANENSVARVTIPDQPISFEPRRFALREVDIVYYPFDEEGSNGHVPE